ncbi:MAG: class I SAM-dependent methyltransferase family protein [Thermomicrobiales bacterium]
MTPKVNPQAPRWRALRAALRLASQVSGGIALGYQHGFDSGPMLDYVYRNQAQGKWLVGRLADRLYLEQIGWRAIRARRDLLERTLRQLIAARRAGGAPTHIADIAAGPGRYLLELVAACDQSDLSVVCRDLDPEGQRQGQALAAALGLRAVRFERGDATDPADLARLAPTPHIVIASGIYELLTDDVAVQRSMRGVRALLPAAGAFVFTTQVAHPQLDLIANVLPNRHGDPWVMGLRSVARVEAWAREAGFATVRTEVERHGLFAVTLATGRGETKEDER